MKIKPVSIERKFLNRMLIVLLVSICMWSAVWFHNEYSHFKYQSVTLRSNFVKNQKIMIQTEVERVVEYVKKMTRLSEHRLQQMLKERVYEAHSVASHVYEKQKGIKNISEIRESIIAALRPIRFFDGRGYFFAASMDGVEQLYPVQPQFEGKNVIDLQDAQGTYVIREEIKLIETSGEGFVRHFWTKPEQDPSRPYLKISFIKYFEPLNWYIGTGEYVEDAQKATQSDVLEHLTRLRFGDEGYFFGSTFDGRPLFSNGKVTENTTDSIWGLTDPNGVKIIQEQSQTAQNTNGGFVKYSWPKLQNEHPSPKISYVKGVPEWRWTIGAGVYLDTIDSEIAARKNALFLKLRQDLIRSIILFLLLFCLTLFWHRRMAKQLHASVSAFLSFLDKARTESVNIDIDTIEIKEFKDIAISANQMLSGRNEAESLLRKSEERFQLAMKSVSDGVWDWDIASGSVFFSPGWTSILQEEIAGETYEFWSSKIHPDDKQGVLEFLQQHLDGHSIHWEKEHRLKTRTGDWKWVLGRGAVVSKNAEGLPTRMVGTMTDISGRKKIEMKLQQSEKRSESILQANPNPVVVYDSKGCPEFINKSFTTVFGWTLDEIRGGTIPFVPDEEKEISSVKITEIYKTGKPVQFLTKRHTKSNDVLDVNVSAAVYKNVKGENTGMVVNLIDVTEQLKLEEQNRQIRKMESIGRLAGGVAHDFNNMLSVILGNIEIVLEDTDASNHSFNNLKEAQAAANRSAGLTRQLLAFARKQVISPKILNLNQTIEGMLEMLKRLIGEDIDLAWHPDGALWHVKMDPSQVDQILTNLCVNARDSIKDTGKVTIETQNVHFDSKYCIAHPGFKPGDYAAICFSDSGCGMDKDTVDNLFEPFFTTKSPGEGTGLGLSTIYGIVKQNLGFINVSSEPGEGSVFKIFLPGQTRELAPEVEPSAEKKILKGNETILLVEDEKAILKTTQMMRERLGYRVLTANSADEALQHCSEFDSQIHLLMTDVVMPSMNGRVLAEKISQSVPNIKVLYMSGYTANVIEHRGILDKDLAFINKPFSRQALSLKLREILTG